MLIIKLLFYFIAVATKRRKCIYNVNDDMIVDEDVSEAYKVKHFVRLIGVLAYGKQPPSTSAMSDQESVSSLDT